MRFLRFAALAAISVATVAAASGCAASDALIWGIDGAKVIAATDDLVEAMATGVDSDLLCDEFAGDVGTPADWAGLSTGEPERFTGEFWVDQVPLDPQWSINLEGLAPDAEVGDTAPGDVFYSETDHGLCVIDIVWSTLIATG